MTTLRLDPAVLAWLKATAAGNNRSFGSMVERLVEKEMRRDQNRKPVYAGVLA